MSELLNINPYFLLGSVLGGLLWVALFGSLFRSVILGGKGNKAQNLWFILLAGLVMIGLAGFGDGTDSFLDRITNLPNKHHAIGAALAMLVWGLLVRSRPSHEQPLVEGQPKTRGIVGRAIGLGSGPINGLPIEGRM